MHVSKNRMCAHKLDTCLIFMYEVDLLFFFCWRFVILKNRLQYKSTKILHGHQWQVNFFISISVRTDLPNMLSHTVWFDLLIKEELRLKCDLLLISAVVTVKVRDLNFSDVVKPFLYSTWERSCPFISLKPPPRLKASL